MIAAVAKLHRWTESAMFFDGSSLAMHLAVIIIYLTIHIQSLRTFRRLLLSLTRCTFPDRCSARITGQDDLWHPSHASSPRGRAYGEREGRGCPCPCGRQRPHRPPHNRHHRHADRSGVRNPPGGEGAAGDRRPDQRCRDQEGYLDCSLHLHISILSSLARIVLLISYRFTRNRNTQVMHRHTSPLLAATAHGYHSHTYANPCQ